MPTPYRIPAPPRPLTEQELLARHEREMRRQTRPVDGNQTRRADTDAPAAVAAITRWFNHRGPVVESDPSDPVWLTVPGQLVYCQGLLTTPGGSTTSVSVLRNGDPIGTLAWGSGSQLAAVSFDQPFSPRTDLLTVQIVSAGTGAAGISLGFEFIPTT